MHVNPAPPVGLRNESRHPCDTSLHVHTWPLSCRPCYAVAAPPRPSRHEKRRAADNESAARLIEQCHCISSIFLKLRHGLALPYASFVPAGTWRVERLKTFLSNPASHCNGASQWQYMALSEGQCAKALLPTDVTEAGISSVVKSKQPRNAPSPIVLTDGMDTEATEEQNKNALLPIVLTKGISMDDSTLQNENAPSPIIVAAGKSTDSKDWQLSNAISSTLMTDGILALVRFMQP